MSKTLKQLSRSKLGLVAGGILLVALAACGGGGGDAQDSAQALGAQFQQAFAQGPNDAPVDVANAGLQIQLAQDPFAL